MSNLKTASIKRIETLLDQDRPDIPPVGTNHVDDSGDWTSNSIYPGELAINLENGEFFTQDSQQPIQLNTMDGILDGMEITTSGISLREINLSSGTFRISGRTYKHNADEDTDDASILTDANILGYSRLDAICVKGDLAFEFEDFKGAQFKVFKGAVASNIQLPIIDEEGWLFLGFVLILPNQTVNDVLRPLSIKSFYDTKIPLNITPERFKKDLTTRILQWQVNTLYLEGQVVEHDNNLYHAAYTHVSHSSSLTVDFEADKLISLGAVTNSDVSRFSHVGSTPTSGNFVSLFFNHWNSDTRILDAFQDISAFVNSFAPTQPVNIDEANLVISSPFNKAGFTGSAYSADSNLTMFLVSDQEVVEFEVENKFTPYNIGVLKSYLFTPDTSYSTPNLDLTDEPETLPDTETITDVEVEITLTVIRDDHYGTTQGFKGFYKSIDITLETLNTLVADVDPYTARITHLSSNDSSEVIFYVESVRDAVLENVTNFRAVSNLETVKYMSGVPVLTTDDEILMNFGVSDAVRYFYNHAKLVTITTELLAEDKNISFANAGYFASGSMVPLTVPVNSAADGPTISLEDVDIVIDENVIDSNPTFTIKAYNAMGDETIYNTSGTGFLVDSTFVETGSRRFSGTGTFPAGAAGVNWGQLYDQSQSEENLFTEGNVELQFFGGKYFYPKVDYSLLPDLISGETTIEYPDYSNDIEDEYRWATFKLEDIEAEKFYNLEIRDSNGITYDLTDGITVTNNFKIYLRVVNTGNPSLGTGWVDLNKAYNSTLVTNPSADGDPALDLGWMEGYAKFRRATFGTEERTGEVWVRIGTTSKTISFKDAIRTEATPELNDGLWDAYVLGNIVGESYVIISIVNGTSFLSDFLNGTTMSSNVDVQVRVVNTEDSNLGTDWIDCNEAYPADGFIPVEYNDPALDLTYYTTTINPLLRKITFGPTTRTGELQARIKVSGTQTYSSIVKTYPL